MQELTDRPITPAVVWITRTSDAGAITTTGGTRFGTAYPPWSDTYQENRVVTLREGAMHGVASSTEARLIGSESGTFRDQGSFSHFAAISAPTGGECASYRGGIISPDGQIAESPQVEFGWCG